MTEPNQRLKAVPPPLNKPGAQREKSWIDIVGFSVWLMIMAVGFGVMIHKLYQNQAVSAQEVQQLREVMQSTTAKQIIMLKILVLKPRTKVSLAREISEVVHFQCKAYREDPDLVLAIISHESDFDPKASSYAGAQGLMQVRSHWADVHGDEDLFDITTNIRRGLYILKIYRLSYKKLPIALAAYNRGQNPVDAALIRGYSTDNQYVRDVLKTYEHLRTLN